MSDGVLPSGGSARSHYDLYGGIVLAVLAGLLFAWTFYQRTPVPLAVQASIIVFAAVGIAIAAHLIRVQNQQDFYGGMALIFLALIAFVASNDLPGMRGFAFGPGTAPRLFAFALALLSIVVAVGGVLVKGPQIEPYKLRGLILITASILVFAATIRPLGLIIASFASMMTCAAAAEDIKWRESILWAAVLTAFCAVLFPYGLNLPFQLWPRF
ncbi:MAG: tripartite tricarboxylate transporter TctB family protein [Pseudomonadota bacterium]